MPRPETGRRDSGVRFRSGIRARIHRAVLVDVAGLGQQIAVDQPPLVHSVLLAS